MFASPRALRNFKASVRNLIAIRQIYKFFTVKPRLIRRRYDLIRNDIIYEICGSGAGIAEICNLNRRGLQCKNFEPFVFRMPHQIHQNINPVVIHPLCRIFMIKSA